jgi:hypothetical protein
MDDLNVEQRRCERLRNLLSPLYNLAQFIQEDNDKLEELIKREADRAMENWPLIEKALDPNATLEELNQLYLDTNNRK